MPLCRILALLFAGLLVLAPAPPAQGQDSTTMDIATAYDRAVGAIVNGNYADGIRAVDGIIAKYGASGVQNFGPVFAHFHYLKGMLLIKQGNWSTAISSFDACYAVTNKLVGQAKAGDDDRLLPNRFRIHSLVQKGGCLQKLKKYDPASETYEKALSEDPRKGEPRINRTHVALNMAHCWLLGGRFGDGRDALMKMVDNDEFPEQLRYYVFMILAEDWSQKAKWPEVRAFLATSGNLIRNLDEGTRYDANPSFNYLASDALTKEDYMRALGWYSMMIPPSKVRQTREEQLAAVDGTPLPSDQTRAAAEQENRAVRRAELRKQISALDREIADQLIGVGNSHYQIQSQAPALAAFSEVADHFKSHKLRAIVLYNTVSSAVNLSEWKTSFQYGQMFLDEFPDHELRPDVSRMVCEVVYIEGDFAEAYETAIDVREDVPRGTAIRDIPDFVAGASLFQLDRYAAAESELDGYLQDHPAGQRLELVRFFTGATKVQLYKWDEAGEILDKFLADYPDSDMRPSALYLAALTHLVLGEPDVTIANTDELFSRFPDSDDVPAAWNVRGDALAAIGSASYKELAACWVNARKLTAERGVDPEIDAYALRQLISTSTKEQIYDKAVGYYDEFRTDHKDSDWKIDATIGALDSLVELGRRDEGRVDMEGHINANASDPLDPMLQQLFGSYFDFLGEHYPPEEKRAVLAKFPSEVQPTPQGIRAWLLIGRVGAYRKQMEGENVTPAERAGLQEEINKLFYEMQLDLDEKKLSNYCLIELARWNRDEVDDPAKARRFYDEIINNRSEGGSVDYALADLGQLEMKAGGNAGYNAAIAAFEEALNRTDESSLREQSTLGIAQSYTRMKDFTAARTWWEKYLENPNWSSARPEANFQIGRAMEAQGNPAEALKMYVSVYANFPGHFDWSTQAYLRTADILVARGEQFNALRVLQDMMKSMGHSDHPGVLAGKTRFFELKKQFEAGQFKRPEPAQ